MLDPVARTIAAPVEENDCSAESASVDELREQVTTLEELLQVYEESAIEQERRLKGMLDILNEKTQQLEHAEEALQTLHSILDSMGDAVVVVNSDGYPLFVNPAARQLVGSRCCETSLLAGSQTYPDFDKEEMSRLLEYLPIVGALEGKSVDAAEIRIGTPESHRSRWLSINARPITAGDDTDNKTITGAVSVFRDVTQRKQAEQDLHQSHEAAQIQTIVLEDTLRQLKQTQAQLIHGEKMSGLGHMVAGIAHEVNNPISFIQGNIQPLGAYFEDLRDLLAVYQLSYPQPTQAVLDKQDEIDLDFILQDTTHLLKSMKMGTQRVRDIVVSLRNYSRLDEAVIKEVDVHEGIESTLLILNHRLKQGVKVIKEFGDLPKVRCAPAQLNQVYTNIISNAIDAMEDSRCQQKQLKISTHVVSDDRIQIRLSDSGMGIPEEVKAKMFDPFFTTKGVGKGTGLGLGICFKIIQHHQGTIEVNSELDKGSEFIITLPRDIEEQQ